MSNDEISTKALEWVKKNKKAVITHFAENAEYVSDTAPVTVFMAGSPGAGKTEFSKRLIQRFNQKPIRIDADEIRTICPDYTGDNAHLFQEAANKGVNMLYDYSLKHNYNVILDGTFAYGGVDENIQRSLDKNRKVEIFFIYQNPIQAWEFTKKRELVEKRKVSKEVFIRAFVASQKNITEVKKSFGNKIELNVIVKDFEKDLEKLEINASGVDYFIKDTYNEEDLEKILK